MNVGRTLWMLLELGEKRRALALQLLSVVMAASTVCGIAALAPFLMVLGDPTLIERNPALAWAYVQLGFHGARSFGVALGVGFVLVSLVAGLINMFGSLAMTRFAQELGNRFHVALFGEYLRRELLFHVHSSSVELANNVVLAVRRIAGALIESIELVITNSLLTIFIFASIVYINPWIAAACAGSLAIAYLVYYLAMRWRLQLAGHLEKESTVERDRIVAESLQAIREIQVERSQPFFVGKFARSCEDISRTAFNLQKAIVAPRHLLEFLVVAGVVASALLASAGRPAGAWLAELALVGLATYRLLPAVQQLFSAVVLIRSSAPILASIAPDLQAAMRRATEPDSNIDATWSDRPRRSIRLERVSLRYAADREPALRNVSLEIPAGAMVGIVGGNGSGKTTLIDVIAGLLRPDSGRLLVDDVVVTPASLRSWQSRVAYVPQQPFLLDASIAKNVALGVTAARVDPVRLREVLRLTRLSDFVDQLPHGVDEPVRERGVALSGGQRQRLVIARALYRGAPVLLMDEPTSSLDGTTEQEVMAMLSSLRGRSTIIMVAHRAHAIRQCDMILELNAGTLTRAGDWAKAARGDAGTTQDAGA